MRLTRSSEEREVKRITEGLFSKAFSNRQCTRCGGLMVHEETIHDFYNPNNQTAEVVGSGRRCIQCGDLVDPVILLNRTRWRK